MIGHHWPRPPHRYNRTQIPEAPAISLFGIKTRVLGLPEDWMLGMRRGYPARKRTSLAKIQKEYTNTRDRQSKFITFARKSTASKVISNCLQPQPSRVNDRAEVTRAPRTFLFHIKTRALRLPKDWMFGM